MKRLHKCLQVVCGDLKAIPGPRKSRYRCQRSFDRQRVACDFCLGHCWISVVMTECMLSMLPLAIGIWYREVFT